MRRQGGPSFRRKKVPLDPLQESRFRRPPLSTRGGRRFFSIRRIIKKRAANSPSTSRFPHKKAAFLGWGSGGGGFFLQKEGVAESATGRAHLRCPGPPPRKPLPPSAPLNVGRAAFFPNSAHNKNGLRIARQPHGFLLIKAAFLGVGSGAGASFSRKKGSLNRPLAALTSGALAPLQESRFRRPPLSTRGGRRSFRFVA